VHEQETYGLLGRLNWDLAMLVELAKKDEDAMEALAKALAVIRERWKPETTARNVRTVSEVIRKGKSGKSNEFGKVVKLEEAENQIIIEYEVCARRPNDAHLLIPAIETLGPAGTRSAGRISAIKRRHGLSCQRYKTEVGMQCWVGLSVISDNLVNIGRVMSARTAP
jgi:hypothetical protein